MTILKCAKVGDVLTMSVATCAVVESKLLNKDGSNKEDVLFKSVEGDVLYMPRDTADKRLVRIGFGDGEQVFYGEVDGHTLTFSRTPNKQPAFAPYWEIERADGAVSSKRVAPPSVADARARSGQPAPQDVVPPPRDEDAPQDVATHNGVVRRTKDELLAEREAAVNAAYLRAQDVAYRWLAELYAEPEQAVVQSATATLLIAYQKAGVC